MRHAIACQHILLPHADALNPWCDVIVVRKRNTLCEFIVGVDSAEAVSFAVSSISVSCKIIAQQLELRFGWMIQCPAKTHQRRDI